MAKRGRQGEGGGPAPRVLTEPEIVMVEECAAELVSQENIADMLGMHRDTFAAILKRDENVSRRYAHARASQIRTLSKIAVEEAQDGNPAFLTLALKVHCGWRETNKVEVTGKDGGPIQSEDVTADANDFDRRLSRLAAQAAASQASGDADA